MQWDQVLHGDRTESARTEIQRIAADSAATDPEILETRHPHLSAGMRELNGVYAKWFNAFHLRTNHLFGRRFWAKRIKGDAQLQQTAEYVLRNPVDAGFCANPWDWRWIGGPLLNADGRVIGVNAQIETESGGNVGIGFAIPIDTVKEVVSQILEHGRVEHAYIGIEMATITDELAANVRLPADSGVLIQVVRPGSPAAEAGLRGGTTQVVVDGESYLVGGDVITKADGQVVESAEQLRSVVTSKQPGDELALEIHRQDETTEVTVKLGRQPSTPVG